MLNRYQSVLYYPVSALGCINGVPDAADAGHLPLFAATLGLRYEVFSLILQENQIDPVLQSPCYSDLLTGWLPELFSPLVEILLDSQSCDDRLNWWVAHAIACACFGHRHLWQDMGLRDRKELSGLLAERFCWLYIRNTGNMKWKRFLFKELGERLGQPDLEPPACGGCDQTHVCFPSRKKSEITFLHGVR